MFNNITETSQEIQAGSLAAEDLIADKLEEIKKWEPHVNALIEVLDDDAIKQAKGKKEGLLAGIPIAIKDNICTLEGHTRAASKMLENYRAPYEATVVRRLKEAGAVIIAKANCDEFAMGSSTEYSAYGPVKNPWDTARVAGGSSGGSGASVATGEVLAALGTDTGGSIRHPASLCGVVGLRPTYGRVSRFGAIAYGSSLDQIGPFTRTVKDSARMLQVLAGHDPLDATSSKEEVPNYEAACGKSIDGMVIGVPAEFFSEGVDQEVTKVIKDAIKNIESQGATIKEISLPLTDAAIPVYYLLAKAEASANLSRFDALRYGKMDLESDDLIERYMEARGKGFGPEVKRAILMGTYALSAGYFDAWYKQASRVRTLIAQEYEQAFTEVDAIVGPTAIEPAFKLGSKMDDPLQMYLADGLVVPASLPTAPPITVPAGCASVASTPRRARPKLNAKGGSSESEVGSSLMMPVGLQIIAPKFQEERLFQIGHAYEQAHEWYKKIPEVPK